MPYDDIQSTVDFSGGLGIRVILVGQILLFPFAHPGEYYFRAFSTQQTERAYYAPLDLTLDMNIRMANIPADAAFFNPLSLLCHGTECVFKQGKLYRFHDYGHCTHYRRRKVVNALLDATNSVLSGFRRSAADRQNG